MRKNLPEWVEHAAQTHPHKSGFRLLDEAMDALATRAYLADIATKTLDIQYYIAHDGLTTRMLIQRLLDAADRGVRVRLLLDDLTSHGQDTRLLALSSHPNIEVRFFNAVPGQRHSALARAVFVITNIHRMHRRMHNKLWLADGVVGITGGRNLGDEYYGASQQMNFTDLDLLVVGPLVDAMQDSFDQYWHSPFTVVAEHVTHHHPQTEEVKKWRLRLRDKLKLAIRERPEYLSQLRHCFRNRANTRITDNLVWADGEVLADAPEKIGTPDPPPVEELLYGRLLKEIEQVQQEFILVSPYFVPGQDGVNLLRSLVQRGVRVSILTNSLATTDLPLVHGGYSLYREALIDAGVALYEMRGHSVSLATSLKKVTRLESRASLHSKALIFDRRSVFVGSFNMDPRSALWNTEIGVLLEQPELAEKLRSLMLSGMHDREVSYKVERDVHGHVRWHYSTAKGPGVKKIEPGSLTRKLLSWFSRTFAPEELL